MLITPEQNTLASSALCRSIENNLFYRMVRSEVKTERVINVLIIQYTTCSIKIHLISQLLDQSNLICFC
jgi:hypothetical protein